MFPRPGQRYAVDRGGRPAARPLPDGEREGSGARRQLNWARAARHVVSDAAKRSETSDAAKNHRMTTSPARAPANCATMNMGTSAGAMPEKLSVNARAIVTAGIGERRRRGEPVGRRDIEADRNRNRLALEARHRENGDDQAEGGDEFREPLRRAGARLDRELEQGQFEHAVRDQSPDAAADDLRARVRDEFPPRMVFAQAHHQRDRGIEMRAGDRPERQDQHHQNRPGRQGVSQQRERDVAAREPLAHDAGADDGRHQQPGPEAFGRETFGQGKSHAVATRRP